MNTRNREAWDKRWDEFESGDYEERVAVFKQTLDEPELPNLMDGEMAFETLSRIFKEAVERDERDRFDALVKSLRERVPDVYEKEAGYFLNWRILNALVMKRPELVDSLAREFALIAHKEFDTWAQVEARLAYHGYLTTLVEAMRLAWPQVRKSGDILDWAIDEFIVHAARYELLNYAAQADAPDANDPALLDRVKFFYGDELDAGRMAADLDSLTGRATRQWTMDDFKLDQPRPRSRKKPAREEGEDAVKGEKNLSNLTMQFAGYAHRVEGVPYSKAMMAGVEIARFILERHAGELEQDEGGYGSSGRKRGAMKGSGYFGHLLCPDRKRFDHYLAKMLGMFNYQPYKAAAAMELVPAWMRFLQTQGLVDAELRKRTLDDLKPLAGELRKIFDNIHSDPTPGEAIRRWPKDADKEPQ
ncbi:MAG: hypothetical protein ACREEM_08995 [Blastocatellia bacterium]